MSRRGRQRDEDDDDGGDDILTSILFGNINEDGRADVDYLDEDARQNLTVLGNKLDTAGGLVKEVAADGGGDASWAVASVRPVAGAVDYECETDEADDYDAPGSTAGASRTGMPSQLHHMHAVQAYAQQPAVVGGGGDGGDDDYDAPASGAAPLAPGPGVMPRGLSGGAPLPMVPGPGPGVWRQMAPGPLTGVMAPAPQGMASGPQGMGMAPGLLPTGMAPGPPSGGMALGPQGMAPGLQAAGMAPRAQAMGMAPVPQGMAPVLSSAAMPLGTPGQAMGPPTSGPMAPGPGAACMAPTPAAAPGGAMAPGPLSATGLAMAPSPATALSAPAPGSLHSTTAQTAALPAMTPGLLGPAPHAPGAPPGVAAQAADGAAAAPGADSGAAKVLDAKGQMESRQDALGLQILAVLPGGERVIRHTALDIFHTDRHSRDMRMDAAEYSAYVAAARERQRRMQKQHAARLAAEESRRERLAAAAAAEAAAAAAAAAAAEGPDAAVGGGVGVGPDTGAAGSVTAAAASALPDGLLAHLDPDLEEQRRAGAAGRLPAELVDDLALMHPASGAGGGPKAARRGAEAEAGGAEAAAAAGGVQGGAGAGREGGGLGESEEEEGDGEEQAAEWWEEDEEEEGGAGRHGIDGTLHHARSRRVCDPAKCTHHRDHPTPMLQLQPPDSPSQPESAPAASPSISYHPPQPPIPIATRTATTVHPYGSPYDIVPRHLTDALSEALAAALRLQRARDSAAWEPDPGEDFADDYHADELAVLAERPPAMLGLAPEALAYSIFVEDWEQDILWEGAEAAGAAGGGGGSSGCERGSAAGRGRGSSPQPVAPAGSVGAGAGEVEEEESDGEGEGPVAMQVDVEKGVSVVAARWRTAPARVVPANGPLTIARVWRGQPMVAAAGELLGGSRATALTPVKAAAAPSGKKPTAGAVQNPDAAAAAAIASAAAAVRSVTDALLAAAVPAVASTVPPMDGGGMNDPVGPAVPLALISGVQPEPLPRVEDHEAGPPDERLFVNGQHPQMLRMNEQPSAAVTGGGFARSTVQYHHPALALDRDDPWVETAIDAQPDAPPAPLLHNLNDPALIYRAQVPHAPADAAAAATAAAAAVALTAQLRRAAALVAPPAVRRKVVRGPIMEAAHSELIGRQLAAFNVSQDSHYTHQAKVRVDRTQKSLSKHGQPAIMLQTLPARLTKDDLLSFHRPRAVWSAAVAAARAAPLLAAAAAKPVAKDITYCLRSVSGNNLNRVYDSAQSFRTLADVLMVCDARGLNALEIGFPQHKELPYFMLGGQPLVQLTPESVLADVGLNKPRNHLYVVLTGMRLVPRPLMPEPGPAIKPPTGFKDKASLTAASGHVILLEYLEEHPPLLGRPAMGARLLTYYQRRDEQDMAHNALLPPPAPPGQGGGGGAADGGDGGGGRQVWKLGTVQPLGPENTPFYSVLPPGATVLCIDTHMFKAPAAPHDPRPSDFLLYRLPNGAVHLRALTGALMVGQLHPHERVPEPWDSEWIKSYNSNRIFVTVARLLQRAMHRNPNEKPFVSLRDVADLVPYIPRDELRVRLEKECGCRPRSRDGGGIEGFTLHIENPEFELPEGVQITEESKLRDMLRPDVVCAYEAMRAGEARLKALGLSHLQPLTAVARMEPERWQAAVRQLAELNPKAGAALRLIDWVVNTAPWVTTGSYASATRGDTRASTWLRVEGPFDPTGRGYGLCFQADWQRVTRPDLKDKPPQEGSITGTEADLRKLGHEEAGRMLVQWGVKKDVVEAMTNRWRRIDLVRKLATQAAMEGTEGFNAHFVRVQRLNVNEKIAAARRTACSILQRQMEALRRDREWGSPTEDYGLLRPLARRMATASAAAAAAAAEDDEERRAYLELQREGFLGGPGAADKAAAAKGKKPLEAKPKERRIRRVVVLLAPDGTEQSRREMVYRDRLEMQVVNRGLNRPEGGGFGQQVLQPPAANFMPGPTVRLGAGRGRGRGRGVGAGGGAGGGGGGGEGRGAYKRRRVGGRTAVGGGGGGESADEPEASTESAEEEDDEARVMRKMAAGTTRRAGARRTEPTAAVAATEDAAPSPSQGGGGGAVAAANGTADGATKAAAAAPRPPRAKPLNPKPRKPAAPRQPQQANVCPDCGQPGHGAYSRLCPNFRAEPDLSDIELSSEPQETDGAAPGHGPIADGPDAAAAAATAAEPIAAPTGAAVSGGPPASGAATAAVSLGGPPSVVRVASITALQTAGAPNTGVGTPVSAGRNRRRANRRQEDADVTLVDEDMMLSDDEDFLADEAMDDSEDEYIGRSRGVGGGGGGGGGGVRRPRRTGPVRTAGGGGVGGGGGSRAGKVRARQPSSRVRGRSGYKEKFELGDEDDDDEDEPELEPSEDAEDVKWDVVEDDEEEEEEEEEEWAGSGSDEEEGGGYKAPRGATRRVRGKAAGAVAAVAPTASTGTGVTGTRRQAASARRGGGAFADDLTGSEVEMVARTLPLAARGGAATGGARTRIGAGTVRGVKRKVPDYSALISDEEDEEMEGDDGDGGSRMNGSVDGDRENTAVAMAAGGTVSAATAATAATAEQLQAVGEGAGAPAAGVATTIETAEAVMRKVYNNALMAARKVPLAAIFYERPPSLVEVPDYHNFIPPGNVMCMQFVQQKIGGRQAGGAPLQYGSPEALRADFQRILDNSRIYNTPGVSRSNHPPAIEVAAKMLTAVNTVLARQTNGSLAKALAAANAMEHWLLCAACKKWRKANSYAEYVGIRHVSRFVCGAMGGRNCAQNCDYCGATPCSCEPGT